MLGTETSIVKASEWKDSHTNTVAKVRLREPNKTRLCTFKNSTSSSLCERTFYSAKFL